MSLATRIESLVIRVAQEFNDVRAKAGNLANLTTTDKSNLVAAINELQAAVVSSAVIDDAQITTDQHLLVQQDRFTTRRAQGRDIGWCRCRLRHAGGNSATAAE